MEKFSISWGLFSIEIDGKFFFSTHFQDTDSINLYKTMRETLVYLTHLDHKDTEQIMTQKLARQVRHNNWLIYMTHPFLG